MKKIKYIITILIVVVGIIIINFKTLKRIYVKHDIERDAVKLLNDLNYNTKYFRSSVEMLKFMRTEDKAQYDITKDIEDYLYKIDKCYKMIINNEKYEDFRHKSDYEYKGFNYIDCYGLNSFECEHIVKNLTKEQINNYEQKKLRIELIKELEKVFIHKDDRWYIECDEKSKIDLPYNVYVVYNPGKKVVNKEIKKVTKIKLTCPLSDMLNEEKKQLKLSYEIEYLDKKDKRYSKNENLEVVKYDEFYKTKYDYKFQFSLRNIFCTDFFPASLVFNQYDEEYYTKEKTRLSAPDPSTIIDHWDVRIINKFKKYSNQPALQVDYMEDGSINAYIRIYLPIEKNGVKVNEYKRRKLPYKENMPIEKVLETYLSDEEQFSSDEKFLKSGEGLFEYETIVID